MPLPLGKTEAEIQDLVRSLSTAGEGNGYVNTLCGQAAVALAQLMDRRRHHAWLIEAPGPHYLAVRKLQAFSDFIWTPDANKALQFKTQEQADAMATALRDQHRELFAFDATLKPARAIEHIWMTREAEAA